MEWQTTPVFLPQELHEQYEKIKNMTPEDKPPRSEGVWYAVGEEQRKSSGKNEEMESKQKQHSVVDVTGDRSKVQCCKEQ